MTKEKNESTKKKTAKRKKALITSREVVDIIHANSERFLELSFKMTGGGLCIGSITDVLVSENLLTPRADGGWFVSTTSSTFEDFAAKNNFYTIKAPMRMSFEGVELVSKADQTFKTTLLELVSLSMLAKNKKHATLVLMGEEKIDSLSITKHYKSAASVRAHYNKYIGQGPAVVDAMKKIDVNDIPDYLAQPTTRAFWNAYLTNREDWQTDFVNEINKDGERNADFIQWLKDDSPKSRKAARAEFVKMFMPQ